MNRKFFLFFLVFIILSSFAISVSIKDKGDYYEKIISGKKVEFEDKLDISKKFTIETEYDVYRCLDNCNVKVIVRDYTKFKEKENKKDKLKTLKYKDTRGYEQTQEVELESTYKEYFVNVPFDKTSKELIKFNISIIDGDEEYVLDPLAVGGCTYNSTTAITECNGTLSGNYINTDNSSIWIHDATINGIGSSTEGGLILLNTTYGWINITNSTLNGYGYSKSSSYTQAQGNITLLSNKSVIINDSTLNAYGGKVGDYQGNGGHGYFYNKITNGSLIIVDSILRSNGGKGDDGNAGKKHKGGDSYFKLNVVKNINITTTTISNYAGFSEIYADCDFMGAESYFEIISNNTYFYNLNISNYAEDGCYFFQYGPYCGYSGGDSYFIINSSNNVFINSSDENSHINSISGAGGGSHGECSLSSLASTGKPTFKIFGNNIDINNYDIYSFSSFDKGLNLNVVSCYNYPGATNPSRRCDPQNTSFELISDNNLSISNSNIYAFGSTGNLTYSSYETDEGGDTNVIFESEFFQINNSFLNFSGGAGLVSNGTSHVNITLNNTFSMSNLTLSHLFPATGHGNIIFQSNSSNRLGIFNSSDIQNRIYVRCNASNIVIGNDTTLDSDLNFTYCDSYNDGNITYYDTYSEFFEKNTFNIHFPSDNYFDIDDMQVNVSVTNSLGNNLSNISLYINSTLNDTIYNVLSDQNISFNVSMSDGTYEWYLIAISTTGISTTSSNRTFTKDTTTPIIRFNTPSSSGNSSPYNLSLDIEVEAVNLNWSNITISYPNETVIYNSYDLATSNLTTYNATINFTEEYNYTVFVEAINNARTYTNSSTWYLFDMTTPTISITAPTGTVSSTTVSLTTTYNDSSPTTCFYRVTDSNGNPEVSSTSYDCSSASFSVSSDGSYIVFANITDGIYYNETNQSFTVDTTLPPPGGGGGSTIIEDGKVDCDITITPLNATITQDNTIVEYLIINNEDTSYTPDISFRDIEGIESIKNDIELVSTIGTILPGTQKSFGVRWKGSLFTQEKVGSGMLALITSSCNDVEAQINLNINQTNIFTSLFSGEDTILRALDILLEPLVPQAPYWANIGLLMAVIGLINLILIFFVSKKWVDNRILNFILKTIGFIFLTLVLTLIFSIIIREILL